MYSKLMKSRRDGAILVGKKIKASNIGFQPIGFSILRIRWILTGSQVWKGSGSSNS